MIGIIGAMEEEVEAILALMEINKKEVNHGYTFYEGFMAKKDVVLVQGGIGKVNASISTTLLLTQYPIDFVINIGSAGGLSLNQNSISYVLSPKKMCQATQLINPIKLNNVDNIIKNLENIFPLGLSPITYSLKTAIQYDFSDSANPKHIILITDGEEGCGENPCKYIKEITSYRKDIKIDVIIIGEIEDEAQTQLNCLSQHTNGKIIEIDNAQELNSAFYSIVYNYGHSYNFTNNIQQKNNIIKYKSYMFETYK